MSRVRYTADGAGVYSIAGHTFAPGDEADVDADTAERLADSADFEILESADDGEEADVADEDPETCTVEKDDGEICGRDLPCRYHTEDEDGGD